MELSCGRPAAALPGMEAESPGEDYESLPSGASLSTHMTAGAVAGILEHTVMYPVDSVKGKRLECGRESFLRRLGNRN